MYMQARRGRLGRSSEQMVWGGSMVMTSMEDREGERETNGERAVSKWVCDRDRCFNKAYGGGGNDIDSRN